MDLDRRRFLQFGLAAASARHPVARTGEPAAGAGAFADWLRRRSRPRRRAERHDAVHRVPRVRGRLQSPQPPAAHGGAVLRSGRAADVPPAVGDGVHRREPVPGQSVSGPGRAAADLLQGAVHALPQPLLRLGVHRRRDDEGAGRVGGLQPDDLPGMPVLPDRVPVRSAGVRVQRTAHAAGPEVRTVHGPRRRAPAPTPRARRRARPRRWCSGGVRTWWRWRRSGSRGGRTAT